jgi:hypothetical protein
MTLCVQDDVENFLQVAVAPPQEDTVTYLIENAGVLIETYLDRQIEETAITTELHDGDRGNLIRLKQWPVTIPLTLLEEDGVVLVEDTDYVAYEDGRVYRGSPTVAANWGLGRRIIDVDYTAGYATVPFDIRDVCARMVARAFQAGEAYANTPDGAAGVQSIDLADSDSVKYTAAVRDVAKAAMPMLPEEKKALSRHRRRSYV